MSSGSATDVLNKTWTYDSENDDIENISPQDDQNLAQPNHRTNPIVAKQNLNATQVIKESKKMNETTNLNYGDSISAVDTSEIFSYNKYSKYSSLPIIISTNSNQFAKASNEIKNFMERFCVNECESLFDEKLDNIDSENEDLFNVVSVLPAKTNVTENNLQHIPLKDDISPLDNDMIVDNFEDAINPISNSVPFNTAHVPETFDLFMNNLKNKIDDNNKNEFKLPSSRIVNSTKGGSNNFFNNNLRLSLNTRMLTSSVDKDLNDEDLYNPSIVSHKNHNRLSNIKANDLLKKKQLIAAKNNEFKTSSPFKSKLLNTTVEIKSDDKPTNMTCEMEMGDSMRLDITEGDQQRVVFNATYTSWATNEQQLQIDALNQKSSFQCQKSAENNVKANEEFNMTKVIVSDDEAMEGVEESEKNPDMNRTREIFTTKKSTASSSTSSSLSGASSVASSTSSLATNRVLNTTRDIDDKGSETKKRLSPVIVKNDKVRYSVQTTYAKPNVNVNNKMSLKQPMISNNSGAILNKITSKLTPPTKIKTQSPISQSSEHTQTKFPSPTTLALTKSSTQHQLQTKIRQPLTSTSTNNVVSPTLSSSNSVFKVPGFGFQKPTGTSSTLKKPLVNTIKSNDNNNTDDGNGINLNRLSTASMTSSVSSTSSSSSSTKENNSLKLKSPTSANTNVKSSASTTNLSNNLNRLKNPTCYTQASSVGTSSIQTSTNSKAQSTVITAPKVASNLPVPQRTQLKAPSQIPTFKIPVLKNANTLIKK